jgi:formylglycine-generating enzyme required for sulfatase activity
MTLSALRHGGMALGVAFLLSSLSTNAQVLPAEGQPWQNSLGMKFVPAGTKGILVDVWDTRLKDFDSFVRATRYDATRLMNSDGIVKDGDSWALPGFDQTPDCPVSTVSWDDARAFCLWLTEKERWERVISRDQYYRLPTDAEWTAAAGDGLRYPWGEQDSPPPGAGNYAFKDDGFFESTLDGADGYKNTSPVGSFSSNAYGLYDMGGNLWEWCEDWYRKEMNDIDARTVFPILQRDGGGHAFHVLRGASWRSCKLMRLRTSAREFLPAPTRLNYDGFRCVLVISPGHDAMVSWH